MVERMDGFEMMTVERMDGMMMDGFELMVMGKGSVQRKKEMLGLFGLEEGP